MTEEGQGGEQIGRLWVEVGGDAKSLDDLLANVEGRLKEFIKTEYQARIGVRFEESGGASSRPQGLIDRHGRAIGAAIGQSALGQIEGKPVRIKDVKVEAKPRIDKDTLVAGLQGALNGHPFKLTIDTDHLRGQIQSAFGNVQPGSFTGGGQPNIAQSIGGISQAFREEFDKRLTKLSLNSSGGPDVQSKLGDALEVIADEIRRATGGARSGTGPTSALEDLLTDLGDDFSQWAKKSEQILGGPDLSAELDKIATKIGNPAGTLHQDFFAARNAAPPRQDPNANATFVAQAASVIAKAVHEQAPVQNEAPTQSEEVRRRRATLSDATFVGKPFSADLVAQFVGKYFTPELSRIGGSKNQPDFGALANLAEYSEKEAGTGRPSPTGRYIGFDAESKAPTIERLKAGRPVRYPEGEVRRLSIGQVLTQAVSRLRGQPSDEFPDDIQQRLSKIIEVAETASRNTPTVKPGSSNRSGILSLSPSLQSYAQQDVRLSEINRVIGRIQSGGGGAFAARRLVGLQSERDRLVEGGAQSIKYPSRFDRNIARAGDRLASRRSRQAVEAGVGKTPGELALEERQRAEEDTARNLADPYSKLIHRIPQELQRGGNTAQLPVQRFISERFRAIRDEARENFGGKLPRGVGQVLANEVAAIRNLVDPRNGGTAVPSGGGKSTFTRGRSFAEEDVQAAERGKPTGVARTPLPTARSLRQGELEARLGSSASEEARGSGFLDRIIGQDARAGAARTQRYVRRSTGRSSLDEESSAVRSRLADEALAVYRAKLGKRDTTTGGESLAAAKKFILSGNPSGEGAHDQGLRLARQGFLLRENRSPELAAIRERQEQEKARQAQNQQELERIRGIRTKARSFIEENQGLGLQGVLDKSGSKRGAVRRLSKEVEDEVRDMLRTPSAGSGGKRSRSLEERGESGEPNSIARALGRDFIRDRNMPKTGDELRAIYARTASGVPPEAGFVPKEGTLSSRTVGGPYVTPERRAELAGGGGGGGESTGRGGFSFPLPLPVSIVQSIPLTIMGGHGGVAASDGGSAPVDAEERVAKRQRYRRKNINAQDIGTAADQGKVYTFDPEVYAEQEKRAEAKAARGREGFLLSYNERRDREAARQTQTEARGPRQSKFNARNADLRSQFGDFADDDLASIRGQLRRAQRSVPKRGFGASVTDLLTSFFGGKGFEKQLEFLGRAEREGAELSGLNKRRGDLRADRRAIFNQARELPAEERRPFINQNVAPINKELRELAPAIRLSTRRFQENVQNATKFSTVLGSFRAAAAGGAVAGGLGVLQFGLGNALATPIITAFNEIGNRVGNELDRISGFTGRTTAVTGELAAGTIAAGGRGEVAFNASALATGLSAKTADRLLPILTERAETEAGNQQLQKNLDQLNAAIKVREENFNRTGDKSLTQGTGGLFGSGIGGSAPTSELISTQFDLLPDKEGRDKLTQRLSESNLLLGPEISPATREKAANFSDDVLKQLARSQDIIKFFNDGLEKGGEAALKFSTNTEQVSDADRRRQEQAFRDVGANGLADKVREQRVVLTENGQAVTDSGRITDALAAINSPKIDPEVLLKTLEPQLKAQLYLIERQRGLTTQTDRISEGISVGAQPFTPATTGFTPGEAKRFKGELAGVQTIFNQITREASAARGEAVDFFRHAFPGNEQGAQEFSDALAASAQYGQQISKIEIGVQTAQAALAAKQYSFQIAQVRRSLSDALGLQGKITSGANNLGVIERQQYDLQRQSQALSLGQSQRQINFQRAIAGLTAPGLTGEERAARIEQAKIEADFAQKQLDIQKKLFGLSGKQFEITADRNVIDLTRNLELLQEGREVTLKTAVATKQIQALTALQARENKRIQAFYQSAVEATGAVMQLEAQLVAATGVALSAVGALVLEQVRRVYTGLIKELNGTVSSTSGGGGGRPGKLLASGGVFNTTGAQNITVGEAGNETVAVLRNPRSVTGSFGGGGGGTTIVIDLTGASFSTEQQQQRLVRDVQDAVERGLAKKGNLLGLR